MWKWAKRQWYAGRIAFGLALGILVFLLLTGCATVPRSLTADPGSANLKKVVVWNSRPAGVITAESAPVDHLESPSASFGGLDWTGIGAMGASLVEPLVGVVWGATEVVERTAEAVGRTEYTVVTVTGPADKVSDPVMLREPNGSGRAIVLMGQAAKEYMQQ